MYLGLDIGTSSVKGVLMDGAERVVASRTAPLEVSRPHAGWSEQDPESWWTACEKVLDGLAREHPKELGAVRGIGLSGHMHGATLLDAADKPLRPCILWNDVRSADEAAELDRDPKFRKITGNIVFPGFTAPKLVWVERHEKATFARVAKVLLPKDYVRLKLTGDHASEMSDSAGTSWLDVAGRDWSDDLLAATHLSRKHMPKLYEGSAPTGKLRAELARRWGMGSAPVVAGGGGDNAASACGVGVVRPGTAFVSLGTSGVLFVSNARFSPDPATAVHAFCHAVPDTWHQMGVILSAAGALDWLAGVFATDAGELTRPLEGHREGPGEVAFLPYLGGERTPHNDANIRGSFVGLSYGADRTALARAVLEGVSFAFADSLAALRSAGADVKRALAVGGGSRSRRWLQILADTLDIVIDLPEEGDFGAGLGAARLGLIAAENADPFAVCAQPKIRETVEPDRKLVPAFAEAYLRYKKLYPATKEATSR
ncbi:MAG TPA: xylulokinase [Bauldia sp.]|nr:xylulokinase [Bauldia sp.]